MPSDKNIKNNQALVGALRTGFIDRFVDSSKHLQPTLLLNDQYKSQKISTTLIQFLNHCNEFWFSVAFVSNSGLKVLQNTFKELEERGIPGKILVSQYLYFTDPKALKSLMQFSNIEGRLVDDKNFHGKGYLFFRDDRCDLIVGSSNLTADALSTNAELNIKITALHESKIINETTETFAAIFKDAKPLTTSLIDDYAEHYKLPNQYLRDESTAIITPNLMQTNALQRLATLRTEGSRKSLIISATGTGKTVLAAFDVKAFEAKKLLYVVHRKNIAEKTMETFRDIFNDNISMGLYSGAERDNQSDFIFSTVQTINQDHHLNQFAADFFDYIIIDETHRAGADTYKKVLDYFRPQFLLGMTATPERTDGFDIFTLFNHNVAYEIRLHEAMANNLVCPFHYFGVAEIEVAGRTLEDKSDFEHLTRPQRLKHIIEKAEFYGCDSDPLRGLVFCSRIDEAQWLSDQFNNHGYNTCALSGMNSANDRADAITLLESDDPQKKLDYIFTVDIFNEGIDIPSVNQIIMLRPTESPIIFVQQLGRGLRKTLRKDYLTVIDFIGNYNNNYMIPVAIYQNTSLDKDTLRRSIAAGSAPIPGESSINFDKISRDRIFKSINSVNIRKYSDLCHDYQLMHHKLGRMPMMMDFADSASRNPYHFVGHSKSYLDFVMQVEKTHDLNIPKYALELLRYLSKEVNNSKRVEDSIILNCLLTKESLKTDDLKTIIADRFNYVSTDETILSAINNLNLNFPTKMHKNKLVPISKLHQYHLVRLLGDTIMLDKTLNQCLANKTFKLFLQDCTQYAIYAFKRDFNHENYVDGFQRYQKYSRKDALRILHWSQNPVAFNIGGYKTSDDGSNCPLFVTYHPSANVADAVRYKNEFINPAQFRWMSKNRRRLTNPDVIAIRSHQNKGMRLPLFIKKNNDEGIEFYFMGDLTSIADSFVETTIARSSGDVAVVEADFRIDCPVEDKMYHYITDSY